jgi:AAA+ superfamily predicted ATPase
MSTRFFAIMMMIGCVICMSQLDALPKAFPIELPAIAVKLDASSPIKIQPDFSHIGHELGAGVGDFFRGGAKAFANEMDSEQYGQDLSRGMGGLAKNMGNAVGEFNAEADQTLFPEMAHTFRGFVSSAINQRNSWQFGGLIALSFAISATGYYLTRFVWDLITYKVLHPKPVIILPGSTYGRWDRCKRWWKGYQSPAMLFDQEVKDRLIEIEEKTKLIRSHNRIKKNKYTQISYDNLLLHGKPGTGKTLFARILADKTDMDFVATTAASLLQSGVMGVKYFNDLVDMARRSKYGLIIFVDEADALFVDRDTLHPDSDHYKVLNHILALTGDGSNKFMLIAATNHSYVMDNSMGRRFQDQVQMPLPDEVTRRELIELYAQKELFNEKENGKECAAAARSLLSTKVIDDIVQQTAGLSHAEIKDIMCAMRKKALAAPDSMITAAHITDALRQAINKHELFESNMIKRQKRFNGVIA